MLDACLFAAMLAVDIRCELTKAKRVSPVFVFFGLSWGRRVERCQAKVWRRGAAYVYWPVFRDVQYGRETLFRFI